MRLPAVLIFVVLPLLEIAGFIIVGRQIGVLATILLILATSVLGSVLLRVQGLGVLNRIRQETRAGRVPQREVVHGVMIVFAAFLLFLPGFITDIAGLLLFLPPIRDLVWSLASRTILSGANAAARYTRFDAGAGGRGEHVIDLDESDYSSGGDPNSPWRGPRRE